MNIVILVICLFVIQCRSYTCKNESMHAGSCLSNNIVQCGQYGGSKACLCIDGCINLLGTCINNTISEPAVNIIYPSYCNGNSNIVFSDVQCNYYGNGTYCPIGCLNNKYHCEKNISDSICYPYIDWSCPYGCYYEKTTNSCIPNSSDNVCGLIEKTLTCPMGCSYNNYLKKCISSDPNYICTLEKKLLCPHSCHLNIRGDTCISTSNAVCNGTNIPKCPNYCEYDVNDKICKSHCNENNPIICARSRSLCEPIVTLICPHDEYTADITFYKTCTENPYEICLNYPYIQYPLRLKDKYSGIKCKYSNYGNCEMIRIQQTCCIN